MINTWDQFGYNAGLVWKTLNSNGPLNKKQLMDLTQLRNYEIHIAIGWLARENKISYEDNRYVLSETNLLETIGLTAGNLWETLYNTGDINISELVKDTNLEREGIYEALGWLAREDKIDITMKK
jgi:hypothetical protein